MPVTSCLISSISRDLLSVYISRCSPSVNEEWVWIRQWKDLLGLDTLEKIFGNANDLTKWMCVVIGREPILSTLIGRRQVCVWVYVCTCEWRKNLENGLTDKLEEITILQKITDLCMRCVHQETFKLSLHKKYVSDLSRFKVHTSSSSSSLRLHA